MIKVLLLADTHLGFDLPSRPRVERRRRGPDFFANTRLALAPALRQEIDLVVHGGDLLFRSKVPPSLVERALEPLLAVADTGVPVVLVPGNHERSTVPFPLLATHANLHVIHEPRTVTLDLDGVRLAIGGFPCERAAVRDRITGLIAECGVLSTAADLRLLCMHQTVEGSRVEGFTFRVGADVVPGRDIPSGLAAVLCGHIHRAQVLTRDLAGRDLAAPVLYPGSVERTSLAERNEAKGFMTVDLVAGPSGGRLDRWQFHELPARPMIAVTVDATGRDAESLENRIRESCATMPVDSVVYVRIEGELAAGSERALRAANLRRLHSPTMTVTTILANAARWKARSRR